jgi:DNA-binding transcriptional LysR family regulator
VLPDNLNVENIELLENKLFLVANTKSKFTKKIYDKSIFEDLPLIYREQGSGTRLVMERFIEENKLPVRKKMELTSNEAVKQAVIAGLGYSLLPLVSMRNELENGQINTVKKDGFPIDNQWRLVHLKNKRLSPVAKAFLEYIKLNKAKIINEEFSWMEKY